MRLYLLGAPVLFGSLVLACGSDTHTGEDDLPTAYECPRTSGLRPRAIVKEDMVGKKMVEKTLSLTFDSGPSEVTQAIETYLASKRIRATFFINGMWATGQDTTLDLLKTDGHLIGNRTLDDTEPTSLDAATLIKSVTDTDVFVKDRAPADKLFFRAPYGHWDEKSATALAGSEMNKYKGPIGWDIGDGLAEGIGSDSECWDKEKTGQECADLILKQIREKKTGIVLLHDGPPGVSPKIVDMVKAMVDTLETEQFKFARLDELNLVPRSETWDTGGPDGNGPGGGPSGGGAGEEGTEDPCREQ